MNYKAKYEKYINKLNEFGGRKKFTEKELLKNFLDVYIIDNPRCILCKYNYIYYYHNYPILNNDGTIKKTYNSDHMISLANNGDDTIDNLVPICSTCNNTKKTESYINYLIRFYATTRKNNFIPSKILTLNESIEYCKNNIMKIYYSHFIINELNPNAKIIQLSMVYDFFMEHIGELPQNDIIFNYNSNQYFLSPNSTNFEYLYDHWKTDPKWDEFLITHTLMRKYNKSLSPSNIQEIIDFINDEKILNLCVSDFIFYDMLIEDKIYNIYHAIRFFENYTNKKLIFDLIYVENINDFILSSNSKNYNYYFRGNLNGDYEWIPDEIEFLFMIITMRKNNILIHQKSKDELIKMISEITYNGSDFICEEMTISVKNDILNKVSSYLNKINIVINDDLVMQENGDLIPRNKLNVYYYNLTLMNKNIKKKLGIVI